jgi:hypothetical protein
MKSAKDEVRDLLEHLPDDASLVVRRMSRWIEK